MRSVCWTPEIEKKASGRTLLSFQYDFNGNLTRQTDVTGKVTEYRYDLTDNFREVWDNGKKIAEYEYNADDTKKRVKNGSLYTEYVYDEDRNLTGLKTLLGAETIVDNRYTYNGNGDQFLNRYEYDAWGNLTACEEKAHNRFKFNGQQYDLRARYYNSVISRFTQEDTYNVDGLNLFGCN